ncbi:uncharacterized protein [Asterias amurensis]|uniref:uncharacterized protein isoform X1 n=2 Tax=Asterias amurensis TaxID=7602 RepID=UPI003AB68C1C
MIIMESPGTNPDGADSTLRRPMNAFLLFCKRHRSVVKNGHPWLDNRACTKMLADMWAVLDWDEKSKYLQLARECKVAFMKAHPDYKWCGSNKQSVKSSSPTMKTRTKSSCGHLPNQTLGVWPQNNSLKQTNLLSSSRISPGKLADPSDMGGLSMLLLAGEQSMSKSTTSNTLSPGTPLSPKSRLFEFAEMCSDRLDLKYSPDPPTLSHQTVCTHQPESGFQTSQTDNNMLTSKTELQRKNHERFNFDPQEINNNDSRVTIRNKEQMEKSPGRLSAIQDQELKQEFTVLSRALQSGNECKEHKGEMQSGAEEVQSSEDMMDLPSSDGGDWVEEQGTRRTSARSCKGRLYREFVMEGMLESLQRPERPFNCKKTWKQIDGSSLSDGDDVVFKPSPDKPKRASRRKSRKRTVSGCGSLSSSADFDYGEIDVEARLASLPQYSPAQFKPQGKSQHHKKSTFLYKNSTFVKKEGNTSHKHNSKGDHSVGKMPVAGSRKRKAPKSSILHLTNYQVDSSAKAVTSGPSSNTRLFTMDGQQGVSDLVTSSDPDSLNRVDLKEQDQDVFSIDDTFKVSSEETKPFPSPLLTESHQLPRSSSHVISAASSVHRSVLTVS